MVQILVSAPYITKSRRLRASFFMPKTLATTALIRLPLVSPGIFSIIVYTPNIKEKD